MCIETYLKLKITSHVTFLVIHHYALCFNAKMWLGPPEYLAPEIALDRIAIYLGNKHKNTM